MRASPCLVSLGELPYGPFVGYMIADRYDCHTPQLTGFLNALVPTIPAQSWHFSRPHLWVRNVFTVASECIETACPSALLCATTSVAAGSAPSFFTARTGQSRVLPTSMTFRGNRSLASIRGCAGSAVVSQPLRYGGVEGLSGVQAAVLGVLSLVIANRGGTKSSAIAHRH